MFQLSAYIIDDYLTLPLTESRGNEAHCITGNVIGDELINTMHM